MRLGSLFAADLANRAVIRLGSGGDAFDSAVKTRNLNHLNTEINIKQPFGRNHIFWIFKIATTKYLQKFQQPLPAKCAECQPHAKVWDICSKVNSVKSSGSARILVFEKIGCTGVDFLKHPKVEKRPGTRPGQFQQGGALSLPRQGEGNGRARHCFAVTPT
jgi:hypothetical protein